MKEDGPDEVKQKNRKGCLIMLLVVPPAFFVAGQFAVRLPFIKNWPYTWAIYGAAFATGGILLLLRYHGRMCPPAPLSLRSYPLSFLGLACMLTAFLSFAVRSGVEGEFAYEFEDATIVSKYRSSHNQPALKIVTKTGRRISLDINGQEELWKSAKPGDRIDKEFMDDTVKPAVTKQ